MSTSLSFALPAVAESSEPNSPDEPATPRNNQTNQPTAASSFSAQPVAPASASASASSSASPWLSLPSRFPRIPQEYFLRRVLQCAVKSYSGPSNSAQQQPQQQSQLELPHGFGSCDLVSGSSYSGSFDLGLFEGRGRIEFADGSSYEGEFLQNSIHGVGTFRWPDGSLYSGAVEGGFRSGYGVFVDSGRGINFAGEWRNGLRHGRGRLVYSAAENSLGGHFYEGDWVAGQRSGEGFMVYPSGNSYFGAWRNDEKIGFGVMTWVNSAAGTLERYEGDWVADRPHGAGVYDWYRVPQSRAVETSRGPRVQNHFQFHNRFVGQFSDGERHGRGTFYYANGSIYIGNWIKNEKNDENATFLFDNGTIYKGKFLNDALADEKLFSSITNSMADLPIEDLLINSNNSPAAIQLDRQFVSNLIARYNTELIEIFKVYSSPESVGDSSIDSFSLHTISSVNSLPPSISGVHLSLKQFWLFSMDYEFSTNSSSRANFGWSEINSLLSTDKKYSFSPNISVNDPDKILLLREFFQLLVRIAVAVRPDDSGEQEKEKEKMPANAEERKEQEKHKKEEKEKFEETKTETTTNSGNTNSNSTSTSTSGVVIPAVPDSVAQRKSALSFFARAQSTIPSAEANSDDSNLSSVSSSFSLFLNSVILPRSRVSGARRAANSKLGRRRFLVDVPAIQSVIQKHLDSINKFYLSIAVNKESRVKNAEIHYRNEQNSNNQFADNDRINNSNRRVDSLLNPHDYTLSLKSFFSYLRGRGLFTSSFHLSSISSFLGFPSASSFVGSSDLIWFEFQNLLVRLAVFHYHLTQSANASIPIIPLAVSDDQAAKFADEWANQAENFIKLVCES